MNGQTAGFASESDASSTGSGDLGEFAMAVRLLRQNGSDAASQGIDLEREALLDDDIDPTQAGTDRRPGQHAFMTGTTGFVGGFLLAELLTTTKLVVHCLVRADDAKSGMQRIRKNLESLGLWTDEMEPRIRAVPGNLSKPLLGLGREKFDELADCIDLVYHAGAQVSYIAPYENVRDANVGGTKEVIRLAASQRLKPLHYLSSVAVFSLADHYALKVPRETDPAVRREALYTGYHQSKWVAEQLALAARERGLPTNIYRLGLVTGHSTTGLSRFSDFVFRELLTCIELQATFDRDLSVDMTPVDFVSKAVAFLSQQSITRGQTYHLVNQRPLEWSRVVEFTRSYGFPVTTIPYEAWRRRLREHPRCASTTFYELSPLLPDAVPERVRMSVPELRFDTSQADAALAATGLSCPPVDERLLKTYLGYAVGSGRLTAPVPRASVAVAVAQATINRGASG
jgi:thioester reductase-like protein